MDITVIGIDLAKNTFHLHGVDSKGNTVLQKRLSREKLAPFIANLSSCLIGMEACSGSNYWARKFEGMGHIGSSDIFGERFHSPKFASKA